jgi:hypothetical protein
MRRVLPFAATLALGLAAAPGASAAVYCVAPASGCADGSFADVQPALDAAQANAGADEVRLGAATYATAAGFRYDGSGANSVTISGAGRAATTLTRSTNGAILLLLGNARNTVGDMRFHLVTGGGIPSFGLQGGSADVFRVDVDADPAVANSEAIQLIPGSVHDVHVSMATVGGTIGVIAGGPAATDGVFDSTVVADKALNAFNGTVQRTRVTAGQIGIEQLGGTIDDVSVRLVGTGNFGNVGLRAASDFGAGGTLTARHLTIAGDGQSVSTGVLVGATPTLGSTTQTVSLRNSIVRGVARSFQRFGGSVGGNVGTANLSVLYSDYDPATGTQSGPGTGPDLTDPRNVDADPRFVDIAAGDLRLRGGSPAIDAGDPAALSVSEPLVDLGGAPRVVDGNGDGTARQDMGAFEYQRRAPALTSAAAAPSSAGSGAPIAFAASATDADGDDVALAWSFDDGASAAGASVAHAFAAPGAHVATVTATDSAGVTASAQVPVTVTGGGAGPGAPGGEAITALSLAPTAFRAAGSGSSVTAVVAAGRRRRSARPVATGATVSFALSAAGSVRFTVERAKGGRKVRGSCVAPRRGNRSARRCTRWIGVRGSFTRTGAAGANGFHFSGRVNGRALAAGGYRLVGSGGAQSVRRAAFTIKRPSSRRAR